MRNNCAADFGKPKHNVAIGEQYPLDTAIAARQCISDNDLVTRLGKADDDIVTFRRQARDGKIGELVARNFERIAGRAGIVINRIASPAAGIAIDIIPAEP